MSINFRDIFNMKYGYMGIIVVAILLLLIFLLNKDIKKSLKSVSIIFIVSGIINLILSLSIKVIIKVLVDTSYRAFVEVVSNSMYNTLLYISIGLIILGIILIIINKCIIKEKVKE